MERHFNNAILNYVSNWPLQKCYVIWLLCTLVVSCFMLNNVVSSCVRGRWHSASDGLWMENNSYLCITVMCAKCKSGLNEKRQEMGVEEKPGPLVESAPDIGNMRCRKLHSSSLKIEWRLLRIAHFIGVITVHSWRKADVYLTYRLFYMKSDYPNDKHVIIPLITRLCGIPSLALSPLHPWFL